MPLQLRPYKPCDAEAIVRWIRDENALRLWSSDRFGDFPITAEDINRKYLAHNGDCAEPDNFYPFTAFDEDGPVGQGYGRAMLSLAANFAFDIFGAEKITLGVFAHNEPAYRCYKAVGFTETGLNHNCEIAGQPWHIIEMVLEK